MRTSSRALEAAAVHTFADTLATVGLASSIPDTADGPHLVVDGPDGPVAIQVKAVSVAGADRVRELIKRSRGKDRSDLVVVVADELMEPAREELRRHGWGYLDRRGELWLRGCGLFVHDTTLGSLTRHRSATDLPIRGAVGVGVSLYLLTHPSEAMPSVRQLATVVGAAPSSVHDAVKLLRDHALIDRDGSPLIPELFEALSDSWKPARIAVGRPPHATDDLVLSGDVAAAALGAPIVTRGELPDFYVASPAQLWQAVRYAGESSYEMRAATVALAPTPLAVEPGPGDIQWQQWAVAHPVVVALDLARDRSRGREILSQWDPEGVVRVW